MTTLVWPIKASLVTYVRGEDGGSVTATLGASEDAAGFHFTGEPGDGVILRFGGTVKFSAYDGVLDITIANPWLEPAESGWLLTVSSGGDAAARTTLASVATLEQDADRSLCGDGVLLTHAGLDLFAFGPYGVGTPFDPLVIIT